MPTLERDVWRRARRQLFVPVDIAFLALAVACAAGLRVPQSIQYVPFAIGLVLFGLPHGALDHLVPARLAGRRATARTIAPVVALYAVLGAAVAGLWALSPLVAFAFFIALTWFHWGQGDAFAASRRTGQPLGRSRAIGFPLLRGALPMIVPLIAFPASYAAVAASMAGAFGGAGSSVPASGLPGGVTSGLTGGAPGGLAGGATSGLTAGLTVGLVIGLAAVAVAVAVLDARARWHEPGGRRAWLGDVGEVLLLAFFFATVPPVLAVGLYFALWHSLRHIVRLALLDPAQAPPLADGRWGRVLLRFTAQAAPVTAIALLILVGLFAALTPRTGGNPAALLGIYLVLISALTLPHAVIVAVMDRAQSGRRSPPETH